MKQLAEDVYMLKGFPPNVINVYVAGDVLIDAATRQAEKRIFKQIEGQRSPRTHSPTCTPTTRGAATWCASGSGSRFGAGRTTFPRWRPPGALWARRSPRG